MERTEERLVERARSGERRAQEELWDAHRRWVAAILLAHRPRTMEMDDLMQEVAVKFVSRLDTLRDPKAFRPWLRRIVINICRGAARGRRTHLHLGGELRDDGEGTEPGRVPMPASETGPADGILAVREGARRLLQQALTLPPEYREPLLLRCVQSMTYQQIGEILDLPVTTVETRLARARRMLREEIGADHIPSTGRARGNAAARRS
ncbi:MAG: sigma-70 family RNA polymerase sigma factor [Planctomycetes bacterium]|nr:sigma-70 family RNA polymerase sigma factor [Planctomycetota bacterium]